jgi:O-antigen/teichoic acid export membrane protein
MGLRQRVLQGGVYLVLRYGLGIFISLGGVILLTRLIGPTNYGLYAGCLSIIVFLTTVGPFGIDIYLVRREQEPTAALYDQAFTLLLFSGLVLAGGVFLASPLLETWLGDPRFIPPLQALLPAFLLSLLSVPAIAYLERALNYRAVVSLGLAGQLTYFAVALSLAFLGWEVWAPVAGYYAWQVLLVTGAYIVAGFRPRLHYSRELIKDIFSFGSSYSVAQWIWEARILVNPLIVGRYVGPEGVGYTHLAIRIVESLTFVRRATMRLAVVAFAKVNGDYVRLRRAMEEAMGLQVLAVAPLLAGFAAAGPWVIPTLFGEQWAPVLIVYPFIALSYAVDATFNMPRSVLYVQGRNWSVALANIAGLVLFAGGSLILIPRLGLLGYGLGEMIGLACYAAIHVQVTRIFSYSYARVLPWLVGFAPPFFAPFLAYPWFLSLWSFAPAMILLPKPRQQIMEYVEYFRWKKSRTASPGPSQTLF